VKDARIRLEFGEGMDEQAIENIEPWVVLSHIAAYPMAAAGDDLTLNFSIFLCLGVTPHLLLYPRPIEPAIVAGFHFHDFEGVGPVLCLNSGIVEPLVQAMMAHAHHSPQEFVWLAGQAIEGKHLYLGWRVLTVAKALLTTADEEVAQAAATVEEALDGWWKQFVRVSSEAHEDAPGHVADIPSSEIDKPAVSREPDSMPLQQVAAPREVIKVTFEEIRDGDLTAGAKVIRFCDIPVEKKKAEDGKS
jgi:hypothetical protein